MAIRKKLHHQNLDKNLPSIPQPHTLDWKLTQEKTKDTCQKNPEKAAKILTEWIKHLKKKKAA